MNKNFLENFYHISRNYETIIHGIAKELELLIPNPVKNRSRLEILINNLRHRTVEMKKHREIFCDKVKEQDSQIKKIIDDDDNA